MERTRGESSDECRIVCIRISRVNGDLHQGEDDDDNDGGDTMTSSVTA